MAKSLASLKMMNGCPGTAFTKTGAADIVTLIRANASSHSSVHITFVLPCALEVAPLSNSDIGTRMDACLSTNLR